MVKQKFLGPSSAKNQYGQRTGAYLQFVWGQKFSVYLSAAWNFFSWRKLVTSQRSEAISDNLN